MSQRKIRIKLYSYDHHLIDREASNITKTANLTSAVVIGPVPLPTERKEYVTLRSPFIYKKSREKFQQQTHRRLIEIASPSPKTIDALMKHELLSGVHADIKLY